jgi:hypothetical protein
VELAISWLLSLRATIDVKPAKTLLQENTRWERKVKKLKEEGIKR